MPCKTCNHTMQLIASGTNYSTFWCPRCGTTKTESEWTKHLPVEEWAVPKLIDRAAQALAILEDGRGANSPIVKNLRESITGSPE